MTTPDFTTTLIVDQTPNEVFNAIANVRGWWSEAVEGDSEKQNDTFLYHYEDVHRSKMRLIEVIPDKRIVWDVVENYFKFTEDHAEWTGTKIVFDITEKDGKTEMRFTHEGLTADYECFEVCRDAWTNYIQKSLRNLITTGKGAPNGKDKPQTENEKRLSSAKS